MDNLDQVQYELEMMAVDLGVKRYKESRQTKDPSLLTPEMDLIGSLMDQVLPSFVKLQTDVGQGKPMCNVHTWGYPVLSLDPEKLALITLINMINMIGEPYMRVCLAVGNSVKIERDFDLIKKTNRDVFRTIMNFKATNQAYIVSRVRKRAGLVDSGWDTPTRVSIGAALCETVITNTTAFNYQQVNVDGKTKTSLQLDPDIQEKLESHHSECELLSPFYLPMVVKPSPRRIMDPKGGGYRYIQTNLIKASNARLQDSKLLIDAVNALDATGFAVDHYVLDKYARAWKAGGGYGDMVVANKIALPPAPDDIATDAEVKRKWKAEAKAIHSANARTEGKRKACLHKLWIANKMSKFDAIYFPNQLCWRSRAYPLPSHLQPQADDPGRALLRFSEGLPLGPDGFWWLSVHLANCIGYDKLPYKERLEKLHEMSTNDLKQIVEDPIGRDVWKNWDKPWQGLQAANEYVAAIEHGTPEQYVSHLPIAVDGTCNGLQHFSAIGLDPVGAAATNLCCSDRPRDIYTLVLKEVIALIEADCEQCEPDPDRFPCWAWRGNVNRATVKRAVMTTPYGVTNQGMRSQFITDGHVDDVDGSVCANVNYLTDVTYQAIGAVVIAAREYMDYLRMVSRRCSDKGLPVDWSTPAGFKAEQAYLKYKRRCVKTTLQRVWLRMDDPDWLINSIRQERGMPPNFIHSLDAAHMYMTVDAAVKEGITSFQMIHDSYATHACNMTKFSRIIREQFVLLHKQEPLKTFKAEVESQIGEELPPIPATGTFNLDEVLTSPYFFS